ncbi:MAG: Ig-like domain-containing protein [Bacteroidales bacterium]|nr:Ig-like domain-containing protein [Bacteroidales bacterium]MCF8389568.1 Ig-like domain-containing protein [Bacteroidales bacterium]
MKKKLLSMFICSFLSGALLFGQQYADTLSFGMLDTQADLDGYPEFPFNYESGSTFPVDQTFTFTAGEVGSTKDVDVNVVITVEGHKIDRTTREVIDSTVYFNYRDGKYISISPWASDTEEGVSNGDYRQINDDEMLTLTFKTVNNTPPNEVYPPVQMSLFGIGAWGNTLAATEVYLNDNLVGYWIASGTTVRLVTPIVTDPISKEPTKIVIKEGDVLQLKGVSSPLPTYYRLVGLAMLMESTLAPTTLNLTVEGGNAVISDLADSLRILGEVLPADASDKRIIWSVQDNGTGATINPGGVLIANPRQSGNGTVKVIGTLAGDGSVTASVDVTISGQYDVPVSSITVSSAGNDTIIEIGGTLQMRAKVLPEIAAEKSVTWSILDNDGTGTTIDENGLVQANPRDEGNGTVQVIATAKDASGVADTLNVVIKNQATTFIEVITITYPGDFPEITENGGTLQLSVEIIPETASEKSVVWSVNENGTGAIIDQNGLLTASGQDDGNGSVEVIATSTDGSGIFGSLDVSIVAQATPVSVNEIGANDKILLFPNPLIEGQKLIVKMNGPSTLIESVGVYQINGQEIARSQENSGKAHSVEISVPGEKGIYLVKVITTRGSFVQKIVKN